MGSPNDKSRISPEKPTDDPIPDGNQVREMEKRVLRLEIESHIRKERWKTVPSWVALVIALGHLVLNYLKLIPPP